MSTWRQLKDNPRLRKIYEQRLLITRLTRAWFDENGFAEVETPIAVKNPGQEPYLNPMSVVIDGPSGESERFYLRTSPEYSMKRLLAAGWGSIYQISKCFRGGESFGGTHNPEFSMIEWYRAPGSLTQIMDDTENLYKYIGEKMGVAELRYKGASVPLADRWDRKSMKDLWQEFIKVDLDNYLESPELAILAQSLGINAEEADAYEDIFFKIFLNKIELYLGFERPVFVYDYPARMCSLSRLSENPRYAQRFELYVGGLELANAFGELLEALLQRGNLENDRQLRENLGKETWPVDKEFIAALDSGIPLGSVPSQRSAGGIALGVDRMVLLFTGAKDINEVIFEAVADQVS